MNQDIKIEVYTSEFALKDSFQSASGTLRRKTELIIAGRNVSTGGLLFAMEMPLSPSSGESVEDVLCSIDNASSPISPSILRFMSYLNSFCLQRSPPDMLADKFQSQRSTLDLVTFDIRSVSLVPRDFSGIAKLKGSPSNIPDIIQAMKGSSCRYILDFNGSLTRNQYEEFVQMVCADKIVGVEQPTKNCWEGLDLCLPMIADNCLTHYGYSNIAAAGFMGFVFKPFLNDFNLLKRCVENPAGLWGVVGSNVSGPIDASLVSLVNNVMPIKLSGSNLGFYKDHPLNNVNEPLHVITDHGLTMSPLVDAYLKESTILRATRVFEARKLAHQ